MVSLRHGKPNGSSDLAILNITINNNYLMTYFKKSRVCVYNTVKTNRNANSKENTYAI